VSLNPGTSAAAGFYTFADQIVTVEKYYNQFRCAFFFASHLLQTTEIYAYSPSDYTISSSTPASKQAVILHDSPSTLPSSTITKIIKTDKIGALYITDDVEANGQNPYNNFPSYWSSFLNAVQTAAT
jgi:hypothetical protein